MALCTLVLAACGQPAAPAAQGGATPGTGPSAKGEIQIGSLFPRSGPLAKSGGQTGVGAELAREMVNASGGICGGKQVLFENADAPDPTAATQEANRLISKDGLKVIVGSGGSSLGIAASAVAQRNGVIFWETEGIADPITRKGYTDVFRTTFNASQLAEQLVAFTAKAVAPALGKQPQDLSIALVHEDSDFGSATAKAIEALLPKHHLSTVTDKSYSAKSPDLSSLILSLKEIHPDVLLAISYVNDSILIAKQSQELGFHPPVVIGTTAGQGTTDFQKGAGSAADGVFAVGIPTSISVKHLGADFQKQYQQLVDLYQSKYHQAPNVNVFNGFNGTWILLKDVLDHACSLDPAAVQKAAEQVDIPEGGTLLGYGVKFAPAASDDPGQNERAFAAVMQWQGGNLNVVYPQVISEHDPVLPHK